MIEKLYLFYLFVIIVLANNVKSERMKRGLSCSYGSVSNGESCDVCGNTSVNPNVKIVGGVPAIPNSWPAQILLSITISGIYKIPSVGTYNIKKSFQCAGTLIDRATVLTAGHCVLNTVNVQIGRGTFTVNVANPFDPNQYTVYVGLNSIAFKNNGSVPPSPGVAIAVKTVIRHPNFDSVNSLNDVAILQLVQPVVINQYFQPACLPNPSYGPFPSSVNITTVYASGWGTLTPNGQLPSVLYNVQINAYPASYCSNYYIFNSSSEICAGLYTGGKDTCQGDSGGGLYSFDTNLSRFVVVGITSNGQGCAQAGFPGLYTRVSYFYNWIVSNMVYGFTSNNNTTPCVDLSSICPQYYAVGYCSSTYPSVLNACPFSCKMCTVTGNTNPILSQSTTSIATQTQTQCVDLSSLCPKYYAVGYCTSTYPSVLYACPFSCKTCKLG